MLRRTTHYWDGVRTRLPAFIRTEFYPLALLCLASGALFAFIQIAGEIAEGETGHFDAAILLAFRVPGNLTQTIGPAWLELAMLDITSLGGTTVLTIVTLAVLIYLVVAGHRGAAGLVAIAVVGGTILSSLLKIGFERPRPDIVPHLVNVQTLSFPSGHAMLSAVTYLTLGALLARSERRRVLKVYFIGLAVFMTVLIGISRVFLGVHFPTDVLAGWCVGAAWAMICWAVAVRLQRGGTAKGGPASAD
ncbi:phosphatase PAP2 family protein [Kaistia dalseonensis]|uniref:Undecaprenyl-diphosphatase n=1 Tax=Kaistia dalseonensis TaxID=410840 RepID=A0ABU0HCX4_9HYPH|nr:phosphatase PAP2 family protein [Kaistia dalseonensis]MCX5497067.1 phosphatase PAP2 family protein [Kaistia dalseonensis]MDQ0439693.1 undecaprenyl-diphosphatase [Kaistia dalseonensis]